jgi:hypothetical protein
MLSLALILFSGAKLIKNGKVHSLRRKAEDIKLKGEGLKQKA